MIYRLSRDQFRWLVLLLAALAYFIIYPQDVAAVIGPPTQAISTVLAVSQVVSPWLYALAGVAVICWTASRIWGRRTA
jgi:hypothetical protein